MPTYTLHYFNGRGRAEVCRLLFVVAGQKFEDKRYDQTSWPAFKQNTPMGQLPCLNIDGEMYFQSKAMVNYLANEFGLQGKNNLEQFKINIVIETVVDLAETMAKIRYEKDESKKAEIIKKINEDMMPKTLKFLEGKVSGEYFIGGSLTVADLMIFNVLEQVLKTEPNLLNNFPKLKALVKKVGSNPKIAEYIKHRPETPF